MIRIDKAKIYAYSDVINDIDLSVFKEIKETENGKVKTKWINSKINIPGLKYIEYRERNEQIIIETTSKILLDNYYDMITIDTVEQLFDKINNTGIVKIDKTKIDQFNTYSLDITQNIDAHLIGEDLTPGKVINSCATITNDKFETNRYKGKKDDKYRTGIEYRTRLKENNERLIIYDKETEVNRSKKGDKVSKLFWDNVSRPLILRNKFENIVRPEMNIRSKDRMREYLKTDNFIQILQSKEQPLYKIFSKIKRYDYSQLELFNYPDHYKWYMIEKIEGRKSIIKKCDYNIELIRGYMRQYLEAKNISRYIREYSLLITEMLMENNNEVFISKEIIEKFEQQLKMAI